MMWGDGNGVHPTRPMGAVWGGSPAGANVVPMQRDYATVRVRQSKRRWPRRRAQRWYWVVICVNGRKLGQSSEMYTNKADCEAVARKLFQPSRPIIVVVK